MEMDSLAKRVLVVDDSRTGLHMMSKALKEAGCEVATSEDMWVAGMLTEFKPNIIVMDIMLGELASGLDAAKAIRKRDKTNEYFIVLHSSLDRDLVASYVHHCGADGFIIKQPNPERFVEELLQLYLEKRVFHSIAHG